MCLRAVSFEGGRVPKMFVTDVALRRLCGHVLADKVIVRIRLLVELHTTVHTNKEICGAARFTDDTPGNCK